MRLVLVAGTTETAAIDGISAAGASADARTHTPAADAEILVYGRPVASPVVPVSPSGCPTPAVVTRAVRELAEFPVTVVDAGLPASTDAPTVDIGARPGGDVRTATPVSDAAGSYAAARAFGRRLPDDEHLWLAESIPGGTTTALGVLTALGERATVSSSLPDHPIELKRSIVEAGLAASDLEPGGASGASLEALGAMGDPVLASAAGLARGALETDTPLTLAGGTQLLAVAAVLRHDGVAGPLSLATTSFLRDDESADLPGLAADLDVAVTVTDPGFETLEHPAARAYCEGEAKEGVGMGGSLAIARQSGVSMTALRDRFERLTDELVDAGRETARPPTEEP